MSYYYVFVSNPILFNQSNLVTIKSCQVLVQIVFAMPIFLFDRLIINASFYQKFSCIWITLY